MYLTPKQVAQELNVSRSQIYAMIKDGRLPSVSIGRLKRIDAEALQRHLEAERCRAAMGAGV